MFKTKCVCVCVYGVTFNLPGSFFVRNDAFVIIDFETVTVDVTGVRATLNPIGPSLG